MHEPLCEALLEKLCTAVQKVQEQYATGQEVIKDGEPVNQLCQSVDEIFSHGLREGILNWASGSETTYWPVVVKITYKEVLQSINRISSIKNDKEKCQVWVRMACQENSLGSYLNIITQDDKLLTNFYQPHAFVFDKEKVDTAKTALLYGLSHLDFNISLDVPRTRNNQSMAASISIPEKSSTANGLNSSYTSSYSSSYSNSITKGKDGVKKKKKVKSSVAVIADSFDDEMMPSVEKYLYNMSTSHDENNTDNHHVESNSKLSSRDNEDISSHSPIETHSTIATKDNGNTSNLSNNEPHNNTTTEEKGRFSGLYLEEPHNTATIEEKGGFSGLYLEETHNTTTIEEKGGFSDLSQNELYNYTAVDNHQEELHNSTSIKGSSEFSNLTKKEPHITKANDVKTDDNEELSDPSQNVAKPNLVYSNIENGLDNHKHLCSKEENNSIVEIIAKNMSNINMEDNQFHVDDGAENTNGHNDTQLTLQSSSKDFADMNNFADKTTKNQHLLQNQPNDEQHKAEDNNQQFEQEEKPLDNDFEYQVSCAHFEYGTPTEHSPCSALKERSLSELSPEENEDLNFVPGIHKTDTWDSRSGSFSSLTGSGSFNSQSRLTEQKTRTSTVDSKSYVSSSPVNESWRYVTSSLESKERKDSRADDISIATEDSLGDLAMFEELLGMNEDHFSSPESFMGLSSSEEIHHAIVSCKEMIKTAQNPEEKKKLIKNLIHLRMKQQETKDESSNNKIPDARKIVGHHFVKEQDTSALSNVVCDRCGKWIWTMWKSLFTCQHCQFHSHRKCLDLIRRQCASRKVSVSPYSLSIVPESGLHTQQYKCVECRKVISLTKSGQGEARLCDYSGQYFCEDCHWNDCVVIPARIVHNWDFGTYKVSRQTKQYLDLMAKKPMLNLEQINPALFKFVGELRDIKRFREEILIMKKYFMSCRLALESKLLLQLQDYQHFVDNSNTYSLQDIMEVERGTMLPFVTRVHSLFLTHIKSDCELCRAKGFVCEICRANEIVFAFDPHVIQCTKCRTVFHKLCFKKDACPKCTRMQKRTPK